MNPARALLSTAVLEACASTHHPAHALTRIHVFLPHPSTLRRPFSLSFYFLVLASSSQMHLPFTPHHVQLISACYPPSAALITSGPDYRPNAQELSRLTYYAANTPGKIHKLGSELEKRIRGECRKAQGGNSRSRA